VGRRGHAGIAGTATFRPVGAGHTELTFVHAQLQDEAARDSHEHGWNGALDKLQRNAQRL